MAGVLAYALPCHHPSLHQESSTGPGCLCGHHTAIPGGWASPLCHGLASSLFFLILSYRGDGLTTTVHMIRKLSAFWHKTQRWCTNCFTCIPTDTLASEACLPPLDLHLAYKRRLVNLRILCSPMEINPVAARLPPSAQMPSLHCHAHDQRRLLRKNAGSGLALLWLQPRPYSKHRAHLPLGTIPHSLLFLLCPDRLAPLPVTSQHLHCETYPALALGRPYP